MKALIVITLFIFSGLYLAAMDLTDRIGVGYSNAFISQDTPSVQAKYSPNREYSFVGALGIDTSDNFSDLGLLVKAHKIVFHESNLNFYIGGHFAFVSEERFTGVNNDTDTLSGVELGVLCGTEFFIPGIENVGITFEAGFGITTKGDGVTFRTIANHPFNAGMIFYF